MNGGMSCLFQNRGYVVCVYNAACKRHMHTVYQSGRLKSDSQPEFLSIFRYSAELRRRF